MMLLGKVDKLLAFGADFSRRVSVFSRGHWTVTTRVRALKGALWLAMDGPFGAIKAGSHSGEVNTVLNASFAPYHLKKALKDFLNVIAASPYWNKVSYICGLKHKYNYDR